MKGNFSELAVKKIQEKFKVVIPHTQWENISNTSMEVDYWGVKSSGSENSHGTEVKCSNIPQKS
jgi:hypothetical protein